MNYDNTIQLLIQSESVNLIDIISPQGVATTIDLSFGQASLARFNEALTKHTDNLSNSLYDADYLNDVYYTLDGIPMDSFQLKHKVKLLNIFVSM